MRGLMAPEGVPGKGAEPGMNPASMPGMDELEAQGGEQTFQGEAASPEEQELYREYVLRTSRLLFDDRMQKTIGEMFQQNQDPKDAIARIAAMVSVRMIDDYKQKGTPLPGEIPMNAADEIIGQVAQMAKLSGLPDFTQDEEALGAILYMAMDHARVMMSSSGSLDKEAAVQDMQALKQAEATGEIQNLLGQPSGKSPAAPMEG